jgi:DNA-binding XRE family transcriptional regulator
MLSFPDDVPPPPNHDGIFTELTFPPQFRTDMNSSDACIFAESAYVAPARIKTYQPEIRNAIARGVRICTFIQKPFDWDLRRTGVLSPDREAELDKVQTSITYMRSLGMHVTLRPRTHLKIVVIDYKITYAGCLNILSFTSKTDEEMLRWSLPQWAIDTARRRAFHECEECLAQKGDKTRIAMPWDPEQLPAGCAELRKAAGLSQRELARLLNVHPQTISSMETGEHSMRAEMFIRMCQLLDMPLYSLNPRGQSIVNRLR